MRTKEVYNNSIPMEYYEKLITGNEKEYQKFIFWTVSIRFSRKEKTGSYKCYDKEKIIKDREIFLSAHWDHDADN